GGAGVRSELRSVLKGAWLLRAGSGTVRWAGVPTGACRRAGHAPGRGVPTTRPLLRPLPGLSSCADRAGASCLVGQHAQATEQATDQVTLLEEGNHAHHGQLRGTFGDPAGRGRPGDDLDGTLVG